MENPEETEQQDTGLPEDAISPEGSDVVSEPQASENAEPEGNSETNETEDKPEGDAEEPAAEPAGEAVPEQPEEAPEQPEDGEKAVEPDTEPETQGQDVAEAQPEEPAAEGAEPDEKPAEPVDPQEGQEAQPAEATDENPDAPEEPVATENPEAEGEAAVAEENPEEPIAENQPEEPVAENQPDEANEQPEDGAENQPAGGDAQPAGDEQPEAEPALPEEPAAVPEEAVPEQPVQDAEQPLVEDTEEDKPEDVGETHEGTEHVDASAEPAEDTDDVEAVETEKAPKQSKIAPRPGPKTKDSIAPTTQAESTAGKAAGDKKKPERQAKTRDELKKQRDDREKRRYAQHLEEKNKENTTTLALPAGHPGTKAKRAAEEGAEIDEEFVEETLPPPRRLFEIIETIEITEPHNIVPMPRDTITADILRAAMALVRTKARETVWENKKLVVPQDDRVLGQCDMIKAALAIPGLDESIPEVKAMFEKWMFKLQLAYVRYSWSWKIAIKFKTHLKIEDVFLETDEFIKELEVMQLTVEPEKQPPIVETFEKNYCTRLTRANSRGLNMKLEFNYFKTPLPLERGLKVPEDKFWEVLHEELWHNPISPNAPIVIDSGSRFTKVGTASMEIPHYVIPSLCAVNRANETKKLCGYQALTDATDAKKWKINKVFDPMEPDWDSALLMWEYMFNDLLQIDASAYPVMMTETPDMSVIGREETYEIMFEHFNVPLLYIGNSALMSLYAMGALNGLVIDIGNRMQIIPINDGVIEKHATTQLKKGVTNTSKYMADLLQDKGYYFQTAREMDEIRKMKEKSCYLAVDYDAELLKPESSLIYKYNSQTKGRVIEIGRERFKCPEILFSPSKLGILDNDFSLQNLIINAIMSCSIDTRVNLFSNMMLVGGGTLIPGLAQRIEEEVFKSLVGEHGMKAVRRSNIKCHAAPNRKYLPWKGASIFCTTDGWEDRATRSDDYYEIGKAMLAEKSMFT